MKGCFFLLLPLMFVHDVFAQGAADVVRKADERARGKTSHATITIQIIRPSWKREIGLKVWTQGNAFTTILITDPSRDKGIVFLKRKKEVWNWIPAIERNIKLPPSMMSQSWMGTDFTNDDLVKEASVVEDYHHAFLTDSLIDDMPCYAVQLKPRADAAVVWGEIILWIEKRDFLILHAKYFDESGKLINIMHGSEIKNLGGRMLPSRLEMIPADKKGNKTIMLYHRLEFDQILPENIFTTANMPRMQ